jgi:membrane associated rhomboid family serine protease
MLYQLHSALALVLPIAATMWLLHLLNKTTGDRLNWVGALKPRSIFSLVNIITAPLLHVDTGHLQTNSSAFVVLGLLLAVQSKGLFIVVTAVLTLITGIGVWLLSSKPTIGASGVIFGYLGFLLMFGMTIDGGLPLLAGAIGLVTYGGIWVGVFPSDPRVSWLAHAIGFAAGIILGHTLGLRAIG